MSGLMKNNDELPEGWVWKRLGEALPIYYGKGLTKDKRDGQGSFAVYGSSGRVGTHSAALTKRAALIVGRKGSVGEVHYSPNPCWPIDTTYYAEENDNINLKYFQYLLRSLQLSKLDKSTAIPGLSRDDYNAVEVAVAPLDHQNLIVSEIEKQFSRLDEAVAALKRVRASLKRYKASVLKAAVEGKLTEEWRKENPDVEPAEKLLKRILAERKKKWEEKNPGKKYKEPSAPDTSTLPELPKGWVWATLESVSDALGGYAFESKKFSISGYQIIKMANVKMSKINLSQQPSFISEVKPDIVEKYSLNTGDVIVTLTGTRKKRDYGYVAVVHSNAKILLNQRLARLRPYKGLIPKYLEIAMQSEVYRNRFFSYETGNVGQGNVGMGTVTKEPIAFPPYQEQQKIVEEIESRLSVAEEIEETIDINLKRAERLRQAILKKAFSGRLVEANN